MDYEVTKIEMQQTFKECPACQYSDGFHNMFEKECDDRYCRARRPACHRIFDIGLTC